MTISLRDLVTNPATGRLSTSDTIVFLAFLVSSFVLVWLTVTRPETPGELYLTYLGAWVAQSQASKHMSIKRAREVRDVGSSSENPEG
ncbi:TPA: DUF2644 domain-containing protein [Enterobacter roggenkampii]|uniref:DUF2644 domain-containing protein n=1 Tax=Enterobacteriaceae TaxID=543 RepID=UPI000BDB5A47|nr:MULTISPECIES: DUF2644 domain-containing protein [Enterobacteriaceae]MDU4164759.1 DUF2644 domain-containing protein [Enterobacter asburiae]RWT41198.1 DUF2644 domain-containing protein [Enterobacter cloacae]MBA7914002.1 DUF2644 domain-containing protein [Enterobacter roggenkampii]MDE7842866.1 DUF2644 domain-containing protein [Enterobacter hormaechei]MDT7293270.1 DUF2644 domain-containing protein [Citrobacter freundii]